MAFNEITTARIVKSYEIIEKELLEIFKIVPFEKQNMSVWSPKLVNILLDCGSLIDSIMRDSVPLKVKVKSGKIKKRKDLSMNDLRYLLSKKLPLGNLRSLVYVSPPKLLVPFREWNRKNRPQNPKWWKNYNKIKHGRLNNMHLATIETTVNAVCGLFELISQHPKMIKAMIRYRWLNLGDYNPGYIIPVLNSEKKSKQLKETFLIETELFLSTKGPNIFPANVKKIEPIYYEGRGKLITFLGRDT